jgi:hypothetical protein
VSSLPDKATLRVILDTYFATVYHWIPFLHQSRLKNQLDHDDKDPRLHIVLHAIIVAAIRHVPHGHLKFSPDQVESLAKASRQWVMLRALDKLTIENLQALVVLTFDSV